MGVLHALRRRDPFADLRPEGVGSIPVATFEDEEQVVDLPGGEPVEVLSPPGSFDGAAPGATRVVATLVPDPFNTQRDTIHVHVDGRRVGRLGRHDAMRHAPLVHDLLWRNRVGRCNGVVLNDGRRTYLAIGLPPVG
jgi:hypothetical protein